MHVTAIIAAGGRGLRFGGLKQLTDIDGVSVLERSILAFAAHEAVDDLIVALPEELAADPPACCRSAAKPIAVVAGGPRRQDSVASAFRAAAAADVVVIHDAARPFVSADLISRTIAAAREDGAALAALQARDTVKRVASGDGPAEAAGDGFGRTVIETLPRETIYLAQTPQAFRRPVLEAALAFAARERIDATDEATLAERAGHRVRVVDGDALNMKITDPDDLIVAEALAKRGRPARTGRAGTGYDLHRLVEGRPLVLGGVTVPSDRGVLGHSDGDAVCHAITDAVLGAAGAGDIGRYFPDSDPRWKGASSLDLLKRAVAVVADAGLQVGNVDVVVILERPKLAPHVDAMRAKLADVLGVTIDRVSIKGKTNEGVGEIGRGEAVAVHAIALVRQK
jgi:2-C-methyl-D-erythritol 4-phosphate cytidylyltransferase/2-C-methyl-D-erythritol 2,4-cyclodiphosphate synthase